MAHDSSYAMSSIVPWIDLQLYIYIVYLLRIYAASVFSFYYYYSSYLYTYCILYVSTMTCLLYTFLRFTRRPPSLEIIFDRIRDESRSGTISARRIGSEFQLVFTGSVSVFKNGLVCWQCRSYFCFLLVLQAVASHVCTRLIWKCISRCFFFIKCLRIPTWVGILTCHTWQKWLFSTIHF